jgi:hypothetical protein
MKKLTAAFAALGVAIGCLGPRVSAPRVAVEEPPPGPVASVAGAPAPEPKPRPAFFIVPKPDAPSKSESLFAANTTTTGTPPMRTLYINFAGGTYTHGSDNSSDNVSSITPKNVAQVTIPAYEKNDKSKADLLSCIKTQFARWNVNITTVDPVSSPHVEVVIGGPPSLLGLEKNVGGVAPMYGDCDMIERAVVFVFSKIYKDPIDECETIAHEAGHAMGLDHAFLCKDPMTYLEGCGIKAFQDIETACGESKSRACLCGPKQNSVKFLDARLGKLGSAPPFALPPIALPPIPSSTATTPPPAPPKSGDAEPPRIAPLTPPAGQKLAANANVVITAHVTDDVKLSKVALLWTISGKTTEIDCAAPQCNSVFGVYTFQLPGGTGARTWAIKATDAAGNVRVSEGRALTLGTGEGTEAPTPPAAKASATFASPENGAIFHFGGTIPVRVTVSGAVANVQILWRAASGDEIIELTKMDATTWGADLAVPKFTLPGPRSIRVRIANATAPPDRLVTILP